MSILSIPLTPPGDLLQMLPGPIPGIQGLPFFSLEAQYRSDPTADLFLSPGGLLIGTIHAPIDGTIIWAPRAEEWHWSEVAGCCGVPQVVTPEPHVAFLLLAVLLVVYLWRHKCSKLKHVLTPLRSMGLRLKDFQIRLIK